MHPAAPGGSSSAPRLGQKPPQECEPRLTDRPAVGLDRNQLEPVALEGRAAEAAREAVAMRRSAPGSRAA